MPDNLQETIEQYMADFEAASLSQGLDATTQYLVNQQPIKVLTNSAADTGLYDIYRIEMKYIQDTGKLLLPLANDTPRVAKVSQPYGYKMVMFEVARANAFPMLPAIEETDGCQLLNSQITALNDVFDAGNQKRIYRTAGFYLYAIKKPRVPGTDDMPVPSLPNMAARSLPLTESDFQTGLAPETESE